MTDITIRKDDGPRHGRYVGTIPGIAGEALLLFTHRGPNLVSADHTEAPPAMRGTGAAQAMVAHMIADARGAGFRIIPLCPFVQAQYRKHPDWADVMAEAPEAAAGSGN